LPFDDSAAIFGLGLGLLVVILVVILGLGLLENDETVGLALFNKKQLQLAGELF
jgi:hypothetical protein